MRLAALSLCIGVPAGMYIAGDLADAFPGALTLARPSDPNPTLPPAVGESSLAQQPASLVPPTPSAVTAVSADLQDRMASHASLPVVAEHLAFLVVDAQTGEVLAERDADTARTPASTMKLLTSAAVLRTYDPSATLTTSVVLDGATMWLIGGGDMMLTEEKLDQLAADAAATAQGKGVTEVSVSLDTSMIQGGVNPNWGDNGPQGGWVTPTAALAVDSGWLDDAQYGPKSLDPAGDAAQMFIQKLGTHGIRVMNAEAAEVPRAKAPEAGVVASVESPTIADMVEHTLLTSDNTIAELLAHLVAVAHGEPATPENAAAAVAAEITALAEDSGIPPGSMDSLVIVDGSGLSRGNRVSPRLLAMLVAEAAAGDSDDLSPVLRRLPVARLSGTLTERFENEDALASRGLVRGKTGYLAGAATLAGVSTTPDGRAVAFAVIVYDFDGAQAPAARAAVDAVTAEIAKEAS